MQNDSLLMIPVSAKVSQTKTVFQQQDQKVIISAPGSLMEQLLIACDGTLTKKQLIDSLSSEWDEECVANLVDELFRLGLLIDPKYLCEDMWQYTKNPSRYARAVSDREAANLAEKAWERQKTPSVCKYYPKSTFGLASLLEGRCSTRNFSKLPV